jgi:hypothetical protein
MRFTRNFCKKETSSTAKNGDFRGKSALKEHYNQNANPKKTTIILF